MAFSLESLRNQIRTSLWGRRMGLDHNQFLVGPYGLRVEVTDATSDTTGTQISNNGLTSVVTTTADTWTLADPQPGCLKVIHVNSSSTAAIATITAINIMCTAGSSKTSIAMTGAGAITLAGLSTAKWAAVGVSGVGNITIS